MARISALALGWVVAICLGATMARAQQPIDPKDLSKAFWTDWRAQKASPDFKKLQDSAGCADKVAKARQAGSRDTEHVADIAMTDPKEAASLIAAGTSTTKSPETRAALQAVLAMRASKQVQAQALAAAPAAERREQARFAANLSTGIVGLPGVYLSGRPQSERSAAPAGFQPVAGGSRSCPAH